MKHILLASAVFLSASAASAAELVVDLNIAEAAGAGAAVGSVRIVETDYGLAFYPSLSGLSPGLHGFHVHEHASCEPADRDGTPVAALAAGGHLDPQSTGRHDVPWGDGHLGDLPPLYVSAEGRAEQPVLAPRLKLADVVDHAIMIHAGGDNHSDHPEPLGGGGARVACGVIKS